MIISGAEFSPCRTWRYMLYRRWDDTKGKCVFIMLNPSTADEVKNDPTVERCQRRAMAWGYGSLYVGNIFALRSTDPSALYTHSDPIGPDNNMWLESMASNASMLVFGWGNHGLLNDRGDSVMRMLGNRNPHALRMTGMGQPAHPLYIGYRVLPNPIRLLNL
jgi:hypothetical protein